VCSRLSHRNIVSFIGIYSTTEHPFSLVFSFEESLDLGQYLWTHPTARRLDLVCFHSFEIPQIFQPNHTHLDHKLVGIARGLNHMHDLNIVHGGLKIVRSSPRLPPPSHVHITVGKYLGRPRRNRTYRGVWVGVHPRSRDRSARDEHRGAMPRECPRIDASRRVWILLSTQRQGE